MATKKVSAVPQTRIETLNMFMTNDEDLKNTLVKIRALFSKAVSTIQYDSAELPGRPQQGIPSLSDDVAEDTP